MPGRPSDPAGLPLIKSGFVGRERELDRIGALLMGPARLLTVIGPGGIGKTMLAEEVTRRLGTARRRTSVWFVRLARLPTRSDEEAVREAVAAAVLIRGFVGASAWDGAVQTLSALDADGRAVSALLVMDNCEHVLDGARAVITDLLDAVTGLTILATSREPLGWIDEHVEVVPPLSAKQSLELFRQRCDMINHPITGPGHVVLAEKICAHMHGNPLCIRLAAGRMFYEPLSIILKQLSGESDDARMRWRHGLWVGPEGRHRTIGDVIAWSYELCEEKQQLLFDRLSVFAPGYDVDSDDTDAGLADVGAELEAIEVVCADDAPIDGCEGVPSNAGADQAGAAVRLGRQEIRELLDRLVEQSLVSVHMTADTVHYFLLESLRLFASDRLAERSTEDAGVPARLARRHCYYYRDKVLHAQTECFGPAEQKLLSWSAGAWSNILRAIDTSLRAGEPVVGLQIAVALQAKFAIGSSEIRSRLGQTLAATQASEPRLIELEIVAMAHAAWLAFNQGCLGEAEELLERCVAACDPAAAHGGRWRDRPEIDIGLPAVVDCVWGLDLMVARRDPRAIAMFARAFEKFDRIGDQINASACGTYEAMAAGFLASAEQALRIAHRNLEWMIAAGAQWAQSWAQIALAIALTKHGDAEEALQLGRDALAYLMPLGDQWGMTWAVHIRMWSLARLISDQNAAGNANRSSLVKLATEIAYLAGGLKTQRARLGMLIKNLGPFNDETRTAENVARNLLGYEAYAEANKLGSRLSPERSEPQQIALGTLKIVTPTRDSSATHGTSSRWQILSAAEQEVAVLAAAGWSNSAIAARRGTSTRTTDGQMSSIFQKLIIDSRKDVARFVPRDQRNQVLAARSHRPPQSGR